MARTLNSGGNRASVSIALDPDLEDTGDTEPCCEDEGAQCDDEGDFSDSGVGGMDGLHDVYGRAGATTI